MQGFIREEVMKNTWLYKKESYLHLTDILSFKPTLVIIFLIAIVSALPSLAMSNKEVKKSMKTYVYKTIDNLEIKADVYRLAGDDIRPVIFWMHGGALISGSRTGIPPTAQLERYLASGYVLVSIDYRLAPETKLKGIIEDVEDAYAWVRNHGPNLFNIDPNRIAVMGMSAGGYLTLTSGFRFKPSPNALVALYGYGDITGPWTSEPKPAMLKLPLVSREEAMQGVNQPAIANTDSLTEDQLKQRGLFGTYVMQNGLWAQEVSGRNVKTEPEWFKNYEARQNVNSNYPPTMLLHGEKDNDTLFPQIVLMAEELKRHNVEYQFITQPHWQHCFDLLDDPVYQEQMIQSVGGPEKMEEMGMDLPLPNDPTIKDAHNKIIIFLDKHLK